LSCKYVFCWIVAQDAARKRADTGFFVVPKQLPPCCFCDLDLPPCASHPPTTTMTVDRNVCLSCFSCALCTLRRCLEAFFVCRRRRRLASSWRPTGGRQATNVLRSGTPANAVDLLFNHNSMDVSTPPCARPSGANPRTRRRAPRPRAELAATCVAQRFHTMLAQQHDWSLSTKTTLCASSRNSASTNLGHSNEGSSMREPRRSPRQAMAGRGRIRRRRRQECSS
jgi:hypothetical protein